jgi:cyclophilin family peptidyl-prolyl cis-trans isomerase
MKKPFQTLCLLLAISITAITPPDALADTQSALNAMENPRNPLLQVSTARGEFYVELFPTAAPRNVANFLALANGQVDMFDPESGQIVNPKFYENTFFHRAIPGLLTQGGIARRASDPVPETPIADEINARQFGLHQIQVLDELGKPNAWLNLSDKTDFEEFILQPLYRKLGIMTPEMLEARQSEVVTALENMTLMQAYENVGYRFNDLLPSRPPKRGSIGMAGDAPNSNLTQFFILHSEAPWLRGRVTITGQIVEGMEIVDRINQLSRVGDTEFEPNLNNATMIFNITQVNAAP